MEVKNNDLVEYARPEGVEVKVSTGWITGWGLLCAIILVVAGSILFSYIWGKSSAFDSGYAFGHAVKYWGFVCIFGALAGYILIQYAVLYFFSGRDRHALRWNMDWKSWGFLIIKPLALKYYRVALLLPFFLMGLLPMLHGFCMGNAMIYYFGMFCIVCSSADFWYFLKLLPFKDEDKIVDGKESFSATIIKGTY